MTRARLPSLRWLAPLCAAAAGCEAILGIPAGIRGEEGYVCEDGECVCACGYIECSPTGDTCDDRCEPEVALGMGEDPALSSDPALLRHEGKLYVAFAPAVSGGTGKVCAVEQWPEAFATAPCWACPALSIPESPWLAASGGVLYAGQRGADGADNFCAWTTADGQPVEAPATGLPYEGKIYLMTTDGEGRLVWLEAHDVAGHLFLVRWAPGGAAERVELAAGNRPLESMVATESDVAWKVLADPAQTCDTPLPPGTSKASGASCIARAKVGSAEVEYRLINEALVGLRFVGPTLYYATGRAKGGGGAGAPVDGGEIRRWGGGDDPAIVSSTALIQDFELLPRPDGRADVFYTTQDGILLGGSIDTGAGADVNSVRIEPLAGAGSAQQAQALAVSEVHGGHLVFFNGRNVSAAGGTFVAEVRRLAVPSSPCETTPP